MGDTERADFQGLKDQRVFDAHIDVACFCMSMQLTLFKKEETREYCSLLLVDSSAKHFSHKRMTTCGAPRHHIEVVHRCTAKLRLHGRFAYER